MLISQGGVGWSIPWCSGSGGIPAGFGMWAGTLGTIRVPGQGHEEALEHFSSCCREDLLFPRAVKPEGALQALCPQGQGEEAAGEVSRTPRCVFPRLEMQQIKSCRRWRPREAPGSREKADNWVYLWQGAVSNQAAAEVGSVKCHSSASPELGARRRRGSDKTKIYNRVDHWSTWLTT